MDDAGSLVEATVTGPGGLSSLVRMEDSGTGYPDITASDGVYTGYLASLASRPGHYNVRIILSDNDGAAVAPRRRGEQMMTFITVMTVTIMSLVMTFITFVTVLMKFMTERMSAQVIVSTGHGFRTIKHPTNNFYNNFSQYTTNDRFLTYCYFVDCLENAVYLKQMPLLPV